MKRFQKIIWILERQDFLPPVPVEEIPVGLTRVFPPRKNPDGHLARVQSDAEYRRILVCRIVRIPSRDPGFYGDPGANDFDSDKRKQESWSPSGLTFHFTISSTWHLKHKKDQLIRSPGLGSRWMWKTKKKGANFGSSQDIKFSCLGKEKGRYILLFKIGTSTETEDR